MFRENADAAGISLISSWAKGNKVRSFSGIAYLDNAIIIGQEGFDQYATQNSIDLEKFWDGRFSYFEQDMDLATVVTDFMGQDIAFFYHEGDDWAVSNSFLYLAEFLSAQNVKLTPHVPALIPFLVPNSFTQQLVTENTGIQQIKMLPATEMIRVVKGAFRIENRLSWLNPIADRQSYVDRLVNYAEKWTARCNALLEAYPKHTKVDITGGRDSRTLLAILSAGGADISKVNFCSNKQQIKDFEISQLLSQRYSFTIRNGSVPIARASTEAMYDLWKYGNLGIYYPVYMAGGTAPSDSLHFHGAGGGCLREVYQEDFVEAITNKLPVEKAYRMAFKNEIYEVLTKWGLSINAPDIAGTLHYRNCRSRMHFGRNWFRSLLGTLITPIASWDLVQAVEYQTTQERARAQIYCDLMLLCKPELAYEPFDTVKKSFSEEALSSSPFVKTRPKLDRLMGSIKIFKAPIKDVEKKTTVEATSQKQLLLRDVRQNEQFARSLDLLPSNYAQKAASEVLAGTSITKSGPRAAHLISLGEIAKLCR